MQKVKLSTIEGSLKHGRLWIGEWTLACYLSICISFITSTILSIFFPQEYKLDLIGTIFAIVGMNLVSAFISILFIFILIKNHKHKKRILLWLKDVVEIETYSKKIDSYWNPASVISHIKIQVDFKFNEKIISKTSAGKVIGITGEGYHKIWAKYADRKINILYSPKYDEVLILKDR